jgi:hypothetical protein
VGWFGGRGEQLSNEEIFKEDGELLGNPQIMPAAEV